MRTLARIATRPSLIAVCILCGCAQTPYAPQWDNHFGDAARIALAQQIRHPDAARNADPVNGMDGRAGRAAFDQYVKTFSEPAPQPASFTIGVSGTK